ncbi:MAG: hypothetical protein KF886_17270 [Candidatus Hydrogenedentes bacterium]|nr:hypothetical protein [Candidatus Hydrogenedentota bacterium]
MATKYTREGTVDGALEARQTPWRRQGPIAPPLSRGQRAFVILTGAIAIVLLAQVAVNLNRTSDYAFERVRRGTGVIAERGPGETGAEGGGLVTIEVTLENDRRMRADFRIPAPYWETLPVGATVAVLYQMNQTGDAIQILECGLVALEDGIR